jgi:hypothetical protein
MVKPGRINAYPAGPVGVLPRLGLSPPAWAGINFLRCGPGSFSPGWAGIALPRLGFFRQASRLGRPPPVPTGPDPLRPGQAFLSPSRLGRIASPGRDSSSGPGSPSRPHCAGWAGLAPQDRFSLYPGWARPGFPWPRPGFPLPGRVIHLLAELAHLGAEIYSLRIIFVIRHRLHRLVLVLGRL